MEPSQAARLVAESLKGRLGRSVVASGAVLHVDDDIRRPYAIAKRPGGFAVVSSIRNAAGDVVSATSGPVRSGGDLPGLVRDLVRQVETKRARAPAQPLAFQATRAIVAALQKASVDEGTPVVFVARHDVLGSTGLKVDLIHASDDTTPTVAVGEHGAWVVDEDGEPEQARDHEMVGSLVEDFVAAWRERGHRPAFS